MVSRLTTQKGFEYLMPAMPEILGKDAQVVVLGSGELWIANAFDELQQKFTKKLGWYNGYNNDLAHLIEAGSDMFLMPSLYEPCGLNQMYSLRYGTLPIVRKVGGLRDTVMQYDESTGRGSGFIFDDPTSEAVSNTVGWAVKTFNDRPQHFQQMVEIAMEQRFTWKTAAEKYVSLYRKNI
jgi:starch synthase